MSFTDDELKRLKDKPGAITEEPDEILRLIARLEAAEKVFETGHYCHIESQDTCEGCIARKNWRKAAGK